MVIPNGCPSVTEPAQPAPSAAGLPGPVVGLIGQLSERIDIGILTVAVLLSLRRAKEMGGIEKVAHAFEDVAEKESEEPDFEKLLHEKP